MIRSLLCVGLFAATANAQVADTARVRVRENFVGRVLFSGLVGTLAAVPLVGSVAYSTERTPLIVAGGAYASIVALTAAAVDDGRSRCVYGERFKPALVGGLMGLSAGTVMLASVHRTHMKGMGAVIPVSAI